MIKMKLIGETATMSSLLLGALVGRDKNYILRILSLWSTSILITPFFRFTQGGGLFMLLEFSVSLGDQSDYRKTKIMEQTQCQKNLY